MRERKYGCEVSIEDPRVQFAYDQSAQLFAQLPAQVLLGETQSIDLPTRVTVHRIWREGWKMEKRLGPLSYELSNVRFDGVDGLDIITLQFSEVEEKPATFSTQLILTPSAKSILKERPTLLSELFSLSQPLPTDVEIEDFEKGSLQKINRITLPNTSFLLKHCDIGSEEDGHFQLRAYRHIRNVAERAGHSPQQVTEKARRAQAEPNLISRLTPPEELIAITAPEPIFATRRTIAMTELKGYEKRGRAFGWRAKSILKKEGLDLQKKYGYYETFSHFDKETGIYTTAFIDIHPQMRGRILRAYE